MIREAVPDDATDFIALIKSIVAEHPDVDMPFAPDEYDISVETVSDWMTAASTSANSTFLVALDDGRLIGTLICNGGRLRTDRHSASLSIYVHKNWRGKGVGNALMQRTIDWAKSTGSIQRIHLEVYARNERGIHLYKKYGFEVEGCARHAYFQGGECIDMMYMGLLLKPI